MAILGVAVAAIIGAFVLVWQSENPPEPPAPVAVEQTGPAPSWCQTRERFGMSPADKAACRF